MDKKNNNKRIKKEEKSKEVVGILRKHKLGFGFVIPDDEEEKDIFIAKSAMNSAMNGDKVIVDLLPDYLWEKSREGIIEKVIERNYKEVVGTFQKNKSFGFVVSDDPKNTDDVFIKKVDMSGAKDGDKVVATILAYPTKNESAQGRITEIISKKGEVGGEIKALIRSYGLYETFPSRANAEAKAKSKIGISTKEIAARKDLREKIVVTIDGASAKDLDDAISIDLLPNENYLLGVHIADVSHYVEADGPLDKEALKRGNSTYLLTRVVPMLPRVLSNGVCSLNPNEDRLTLSCEMEIDKAGNIISHDIFESIINSKARLVYDDVSDILENQDAGLIQKYENIYEMLLTMNELAEILRKKRKKSGSLDFDFDEAEIILDEKERPVEIGIADRRVANRLIEEFMLVANRVVAEHFYWMDIPFVYRVHEKPDVEKMIELKAFLSGFGITMSGNSDNIHPNILGEILTRIEGETYENIINSVMIRSMKKAFYNTSCDGHFGLSFKYYCHFTSPIRRYPDLMIHRIIKLSLRGQIDNKTIAKLKKDTIESAEISSKTERKSQEMEREVEKMKKAQYMEDRIGEVFDGVISGVTNFGIYVELPNTVEGMVKLESIQGDYYEYQEGKYKVIGRNSGISYSLGDRVTVIVRKANMESKQIDFELVVPKKNKKKKS